MKASTPNSTGTIIVLIGFRGCGKSTVGPELSELVGGGFVDTDELISRHVGLSIATIFEREGESGFRRHEREAISRAIAEEPAVLSVGGGAVLHPQNVLALRAAGKLAWLTAPPEVLWARIQSDPATCESRPDLTALTGLDEVRYLLIERESHYRKAADLAVETADRSPHDIALEIVDRLAAI